MHNQHHLITQYIALRRLANTLRSLKPSASITASRLVSVLDKPSLLAKLVADLHREGDVVSRLVEAGVPPATAVDLLTLCAEGAGRDEHVVVSLFEDWQQLCGRTLEVERIPLVSIPPSLPPFRTGSRITPKGGAPTSGTVQTQTAVLGRVFGAGTEQGQETQELIAGRTEPLDIVTEPSLEAQRTPDTVERTARSGSGQEPTSTTSSFMTKHVCANDANLGEIRYHVNGETQTVRSLDLEHDWAQATLGTAHFGLSDVLASAFSGENFGPVKLTEAAAELIARKTPHELTVAARRDFESLVSSATPALSLAAQLNARGDVLDPVRAELRQLVTQFGQTQAQLSLLANDLTRLASQPEGRFMASLEDVTQKIQHLKKFSVNTAVLQQISALLQLAQGTTVDTQDVRELVEEIVAERRRAESTLGVGGAGSAGDEPPVSQSLVVELSRAENVPERARLRGAGAMAQTGEEKTAKAEAGPRERGQASRNLRLRAALRQAQLEQTRIKEPSGAEAQTSVATTSEYKRARKEAQAEIVSNAVVKLGLLARMLRAPMPLVQSAVARPRVLIPCAAEDFAVIYDECLQLFALCSAPVGHAPVGNGTCLQLLNDDCLTTVPCTSHEYISGSTFHATAALLQRLCTQFDLMELQSVKLSAKHRKAVGAFTAFVGVADQRPSDQLLSAPNDEGFVAVKRQVVPHDAVIIITTRGKNVFVLQII